MQLEYKGFSTKISFSESLKIWEGEVREISDNSSYFHADNIKSAKKAFKLVVDNYIGDISYLKKKERDLKKAWLNRYTPYRIYEQQVQEEIKMLNIPSCKGISYDSDSVQAGGTKDTADYICKVQEEEHKLYGDLMKKRYECIVKHKEISDAIEKIEDVEQQLILRMRHLQKMSWERIRKKMTCEENKCFTIYREALDNFEIPKNSIK